MWPNSFTYSRSISGSVLKVDSEVLISRKPRGDRFTASDALMNVSFSSLTWCLSVVHMPCGSPLHTFNVAPFTIFDDRSAAPGPLAQSAGFSGIEWELKFATNRLGELPSQQRPLNEPEKHTSKLPFQCVKSA